MPRLPILVLVVVAPATAQSPRIANPERPTVATHAYAVAPGYAELEQGVRAQGDGNFRDLTSWEFNLKLGLGHQAQLGLFGTGFAHNTAGSGIGDVGVALKLREALTPRVAVAVVPAVTLPTGNQSAGFGAGRVLGSAIGVVSADLPWGMHVDVNAGPVGIGRGVPQGLATVCAARGFGPWALAAELFEITAGGAGSRQTGVLGAVSFRFVEWAVLDAGGIAGLGTGSADHLFVGLTTNLGRIR
jgi:hypothetical protein